MGGNWPGGNLRRSFLVEACFGKAQKMKLDSGQKHLLGLGAGGADSEGWAPVSAQVFPLLDKKMPRELVELQAIGADGRGRARLTNEGSNLLAAMTWL